MLKVIIADNQAIFRAGAAKVLAVEDDVRVVAQAHSAEQVTMALEKFRASVIVMAASLQQEQAGLISHAAKSKTKLVVVAENEDDPAGFINAGAQGVVHRNIAGSSLVDCVRKVAKGERWVQDRNSLIEAEENDQVGARVRDRLNAKQLRIVAMIVQGFKNKEIATELGTSEQVIKNDLRNIYDKVGVSDRLELALFTIHHRILAEAAAAMAAQRPQ